MSASTLIIPTQAIVLARSLRDIVARTNKHVLAGYKAAHVHADARTHHEFLIDGILGEALAADPDSTTSFLNLACDACERIASFKADGARRLVLVENSSTTESDEMLLARSTEFIKLIQQGHFDTLVPNAKALAHDPAFDFLTVNG